uniref:Uncharacterized protein n=1 Tax=Medicago truncatula TaxID=3880 RepID=A2Q4K5_MEDTR|nr:hypothetical protein MtrDRAFT_AC157502g24v2 [Medicago truncatula]
MGLNYKKNTPCTETAKTAKNKNSRKNLGYSSSATAMNLNIIKKLIMSRYVVVKNSSVAFFLNDSKIDQPNNLKAGANVLSESMRQKSVSCDTQYPK